MHPQEIMAGKVRSFLRTASAHGSQLGDHLLPECTESDILRMEGDYGLKFTDEIAGYAQVLGRGIRPDSTGAVPSCVVEFMPGYEFISLDMGLEYLRFYPKSDLFMSKSFRKHFARAYLVPFATNAVDFISFCQRPQGGTGVMVRTNSRDVASQLWLSAEAFFDYLTRCWSEGGYQLAAGSDLFDWDTDVLEHLEKQYAREMVWD